LSTEERCYIFISELLNKFDLVSDRLIASYTWEQGRRKHTTEKNEAVFSYPLAVKDELQINDGQLIA